jgi:hypothetical protein
MQKLSGLVLDHYDDASGEVLLSIFPEESMIPEVVKQACYMSPEQRAVLPADVFALELIDGVTSMRKFACTDPGNTVLSVVYFMKTGHKLPIEAQKTAAQNLLTACEWYDIQPPQELQKIALGIGTLATLAMAPSVMKGTKEQINRNMEVARAAGGAVASPALTLSQH